MQSYCLDLEKMLEHRHTHLTDTGDYAGGKALGTEM